MMKLIAAFSKFLADSELFIEIGVAIPRANVLKMAL
jgi:hypothetical protein